MSESPQPLLVAVDMGYGHLRPAYALAEALDVPVYEADRPPLADAAERRLWRETRRGYEKLTQLSQRSDVGAPFRWLLHKVTAIRPLDDADRSAATPSVLLHEGMRRRGLGAGLRSRLRSSGETLLTTFYTPAIVCDGDVPGKIFCVVTDADVHRIWAPRRARDTHIHYLAPSERVVARLQSYGVPADKITLTGFPLPPSLCGEARVKNLAARLVRLDPSGSFRAAHSTELDKAGFELPAAADGPPLVVFAIGGTGAQTELVRAMLPSLVAAIRDERLRVALVAGTRRDVFNTLRLAVADSGLSNAVGHGVELLHQETFESYYQAFNELLGRADALWTKPSEMTFYGALGLPLIFAPPVGAHEAFNRQWAMGQGAGIEQGPPPEAGAWMMSALEDGSLPVCAWSGFTSLPSNGVRRVWDAVNG